MSILSEQINKIRKVAKCVYLAMDKEAADDIAGTLNQAADTIEALSAKVAAANEELERWHTDHINEKIKNPFAYTSTLICHNCDHKDEYIEELESKIEELQAANMERPERYYNGGWIACEDKPPEEGGYYLVTYREWSDGNYLPKFDDVRIRIMHYQKSEQFTGWNFPKMINKKAEEDRHMEVLAYMELPEPYRP